MIGTSNPIKSQNNVASLTGEWHQGGHSDKREITQGLQGGHHHQLTKGCSVIHGLSACMHRWWVWQRCCWTPTTAPSRASRRWWRRSGWPLVTASPIAPTRLLPTRPAASLPSSCSSWTLCTRYCNGLACAEWCKPFFALHARSGGMGGGGGGLLWKGSFWKLSDKKTCTSIFLHL